MRAVSRLPSRSSTGLMKRSLNGSESSISSRVKLWSRYCASRSAIRSCRGLAVTACIAMMMPLKARKAKTILKMLIQLHLDVRDFRDDAVADRDRDQTHPDEDVAQPFVEERRDVGRRNKGQDQRQRKEQAGDDVARGAGLRGQGADLALDPDPFPDGEGDGVEDLGEVATDHP